MKKLVIPAIIAISLSVGGCSNMSGAALGAAGGAAAGALISKGTGGDHTGRDAAIGAAIGGIGGYAWSAHMEKQRKAIEDATKDTDIDVIQTPDNELKIQVPSDFSFDTSKATIKPTMRPVLDTLATTLNQNPVSKVRIIGHTDSSGSDAINDPLSVNRAAAVQTYLIGKNVASSRITIEGRGSREPIADNSTSEGKAQNRRIEIYVAEPAPAPEAQK
ncbi:OmpA family protein [Chitinibacter sp. SCUT-21]|uniref:OmpA family protein n=1 Tax=Chitinibacter sp. SCUT-21 TaxID=2970891 RepID=UPI0035A5C49B